MIKPKDIEEIYSKEMKEVYDLLEDKILSSNSSVNLKEIKNKILEKYPGFELDPHPVEVIKENGGKEIGRLYRFNISQEGMSRCFLTSFTKLLGN